LKGNANFTLRTMIALSQALDTTLHVSFKERNEFDGAIKPLQFKDQGLAGVRADEGVNERPNEHRERKKIATGDVQA
ncbi:MAG TPA: hypothetical protein PK022_08605, partial [Syntrophales bacterium]|nr:hypothetical protein [Syntrophales bacterium]